MEFSIRAARDGGFYVGAQNGSEVLFATNDVDEALDYVGDKLRGRCVAFVPIPAETKFGFYVGETVNSRFCRVGDQPGTVTGFTDTGVLLRWNIAKSERSFDYNPDELRHGA